MRSCVNYCSKSGCLLQSEGGSLPIATPLGRRMDRATVKKACFSTCGCAGSSAPPNARHFAHRGGKGRAGRGLASTAGEGGSLRPNLQHIVSLKGKSFASGEQRDASPDVLGPTLGWLSDFGMTFLGRAYTIVRVIRPGVMAAQRSLEPFVRVRILGAERMRRAAGAAARTA